MKLRSLKYFIGKTCNTICKRRRQSTNSDNFFQMLKCFSNDFVFKTNDG